MNVRKALYGVGTGGALVSAFLAGSVMLSPVFAQPTPNSTPTVTPSTEAKETAESAGQPEKAEPAEQAQQAALQAQATIMADQANQAALAQFHGGTVKHTSLDNEHGTLAYDVEVVDSTGATHEVQVNAATGAVLSSAADTGEKGEHGSQSETAEGPETD